MRNRLLATLTSAILAVAAVLWAAGVFSSEPAPEGTIATDSIEIRVGNGQGVSQVISEVSSLTLPGIAVILTAGLLLASLVSILVQLRRQRDSSTPDLSSGAS